MLPTALAMTPIYALWFPSCDKTNRTTETATFKLLFRLTHVVSLRFCAVNTILVIRWQESDMWISSRRGDVPAKALWAEDNAKGHRLGSLQRESIINQLLAAESRLLRCPQVEQSTRTRATLLIFWQRTRKKRTGWRMTQSDTNRSQHPV